MNEAQKFVYTRTYSRWRDDLGRRENWEETVDRYFSFFENLYKDKIPAKVFKLTRNSVLNMDVAPSMRALWSAGPALASNHICSYNCSYLPYETLQDPVDMFYILMCGAGVGFSVEQENISKMPVVQKWTSNGLGIHTVGDSREGWADSLRVGLNAWFGGNDIEFDYSQVRPRGSVLKTMGGRSSGPDPLKKLHEFVRDIIIKSQGRQLRSIEWLDIGNMIGEVVVVGGVRRSSEISFSDLGDEDMRHAKDWPMPPHRYMSNNTAVYHERPTAVAFMKEWAALAASGTGERGIFNVSGMLKHLPERRKKDLNLRTNPCGEILLLKREFCNLSELVVRANDTFDDLSEKVKSAVWLGAMQSTLTDFKFIDPEFKKNCDEERLLGVSITGQMDNPKLLTAEKLSILKGIALKEAKKACKILNINYSVAITCGKPSGTLSQLYNCSSGMMARPAGKRYLRRYRISSTDPLFKMMCDQGIKFTPENGQGPKDIKDWTEDKVSTWVVAFPMKAPDKAITQDQLSAIDQLEWYLKIQQNWCEHNQSATIYVKDSEWLTVGDWVYNHFDDITGLSFLPADNGKYEQAPFEPISEVEYDKIVKSFPKIDYSQLSRYELEDQTEGAKTYACVGGVCEL